MPGSRVLGKVIITFDGTTYCYIKVGDGGEYLGRVCCEEAKEVISKTKCVVSGYSDRPGFVMECEGSAKCEEGRLITYT